MNTQKQTPAAGWYWAGCLFCLGLVFRSMLPHIEGEPWYMHLVALLVAALFSTTSWLGAGVMVAGL